MEELRPSVVEEQMAIQASQGETILLIDDELTILQISKEALESFGYHVITAKNGMEALSAYAYKEQGSIHLAIMDLSMPFMDGMAAITALRELDSENEDYRFERCGDGYR